jgi:hypothetical protein
MRQERARATSPHQLLHTGLTIADNLGMFRMRLLLIVAVFAGLLAAAPTSVDAAQVATFNVDSVLPPTTRGALTLFGQGNYYGTVNSGVFKDNACWSYDTTQPLSGLKSIFLNPGAICKFFQQSADGYCRSLAFVMLALPGSKGNGKPAMGQWEGKIDSWSCIQLDGHVKTAVDARSIDHAFQQAQTRDTNDVPLVQMGQVDVPAMTSGLDVASGSMVLFSEKDFKGKINIWSPTEGICHNLHFYSDGISSLTQSPSALCTWFTEADCSHGLFRMDSRNGTPTGLGNLNDWDGKIRSVRCDAVNGLNATKKA